MIQELALVIPLWNVGLSSINRCIQNNGSVTGMWLFSCYHGYLEDVEVGLGGDQRM